MPSILTPSFCYSASSILFLISAPAHVLMGRLFIEPGLKPLGDSDAVLAAKSNWMAQAAYHLVACILAYKWSETPASNWTKYDDAMLVIIVAMNWVGSTVYVRMGNKPTAGMQLTRSSLLVVGRLLQYLKA